MSYDRSERKRTSYLKVYVACPYLLMVCVCGGGGGGRGASPICSGEVLDT